jgi:magnesium chelatase subunit D
VADVNRHQAKLSVIGFKGTEAEIIIPTLRASSFQEQLDNIRVGGSTPLLQDYEGFEILKQEKLMGGICTYYDNTTDGMHNVGINEDQSRMP